MCVFVFLCGVRGCELRSLQQTARPAADRCPDASVKGVSEIFKGVWEQLVGHFHQMREHITVRVSSFVCFNGVKILFVCCVAETFGCLWSNWATKIRRVLCDESDETACYFRGWNEAVQDQVVKNRGGRHKI